jgi:hypothetical protein
VLLGPCLLRFLKNVRHAGCRSGADSWLSILKRTCNEKGVSNSLIGDALDLNCELLTFIIIFSSLSPYYFMFQHLVRDTVMGGAVAVRTLA